MNEKEFTDVLEIEGIYAKGFGMISKLLMQDRRLTIESKSIYSYFCSYAGSGKQAFPSVNLIIYHLGIGKNRYYTHLNLLKKYGYIKTRQSKTSGKFSKTIYTIATNPKQDVLEDIENTKELPRPCFGDTENGDTQNRTTNINSIKKEQYLIKQQQQKKRKEKNVVVEFKKVKKQKKENQKYTKKDVERIIEESKKILTEKEIVLIFSKTNTTTENFLEKIKLLTESTTDIKNVVGFLIHAINDDYKINKIYRTKKAGEMNQFHNFETSKTDYTNEELMEKINRKRE
jgi:hypothetical protein